MLTGVVIGHSLTHSLTHLFEPFALEFHHALSVAGRLAYGSCDKVSPAPEVVVSPPPALVLAFALTLAALGLFLSDDMRRYWTCFSDGGCQLSATWLLLMSVRKSMLFLLSYVRRSPLVVRARVLEAESLFCRACTPVESFLSVLWALGEAKPTVASGATRTGLGIMLP